jgi:hypothetical protein
MAHTSTQSCTVAAQSSSTCSKRYLFIPSHPLLKFLQVSTEICVYSYMYYAIIALCRYSPACVGISYRHCNQKSPLPRLSFQCTPTVSSTPPQISHTCFWLHRYGRNKGWPCLHWFPKLVCLALLLERMTYAANVVLHRWMVSPQKHLLCWGNQSNICNPGIPDLHGL